MTPKSVPLLQGGRYIIDLLDTYAAGWPYLFIGLMELVAMYWVYGVGKFYRDLENIQGFSPGLRLRSHITAVYGTVSPALISVRKGRQQNTGHGDLESAPT